MLLNLQSVEEISLEERIRALKVALAIKTSQSLKLNDSLGSKSHTPQ
jgi:hypothetical protein